MPDNPGTEPKTKPIYFHARLSLFLALKARAAEESTTVRAIIMRGLKSIGFEVSDDDLGDKRKSE